MKKQNDFNFDLNSFNNINFIKTVNDIELPLYAEAFRNEIIKAVSLNGGHLSSNLGSVELIMAIHRHYDISKDKLLFDVGHQAYVHKMLTGRDISHIRTKGNVSGFLKRSESPFDYLEAGHSSTSLSTAYGMAIARDLNKENYNIIAFVGDSSISSGLSFEALNDIGCSKHKIIIVLNDNEMSISPCIGALSLFLKNKNKSKKDRITKNEVLNMYYKNYYQNNHEDNNENLFKSFGLEYIGPVDGHDFSKLEHAFQLADKKSKSCVIHVKTIKGKGYKYAEEDINGLYHGIEPFNVETGTVLEKIKGKTWSTIFSNITATKMSENDSLVTITPAMMIGQDLQEVFATYPNRCIDVGIAEDHALTLASGLSLNGKHPLIFIYSTFLQRAMDQLNHDLCRMNLKATLLIDRSGLVGKDGSTHQGIYDEAILISTPNIVVSMPSTPSEASSLLNLSLNYDGVFAIKYPREEIYPLLPIEDKKLEIGKWEIVLKGSNKCIITLGPAVLKIKEAIEKNNLNVTLINAIFIKPIDEKLIKTLLKYETIIIYNPYSTCYGLVNLICATLMKFKYQGKLITKCIDDKFVDHATIDEQLNSMKINIKHIISLLK
ncbi:MAG: 1-deoxy-D-xylulose-5-phosphate synthase [Bacilli bacterium]